MRKPALLLLIILCAGCKQYVATHSSGTTLRATTFGTDTSVQAFEADFVRDPETGQIIETHVRLEGYTSDQAATAAAIAEGVSRGLKD